MLEGTLESFALPDVFQLLALTKKTGTLRLRRSGGDGRVLLQDGQVVFAGSSSDRLALGRRLVGAGLLSTDGLRQALEQQRRAREAGEGTRIGRILVELGEIDEDTLETFVREQIQDAVFDLMRWPDGSFSFDEREDDSLAQEPIQLAVSVENLIMEGSRRLEEWEQVRRKIPDLDAVVGMAPVVSEGDTVDVNLQPDEWRLLTVVDGRRSVRELVDLFGQGEFHLCRILYGMVASGLLVVQPAADGGPVSDLLVQRQLLRDLEEAAERAAAETSRPASPPSRPETAPAPAATPREAPPAASPSPRERSSPASPSRPATPSSRPSAAPQGPRESNPPRPVEQPTATARRSPEARGGDDQPRPERPPLTADPDLSADLVQRLIDGVKEL